MRKLVFGLIVAVGVSFFPAQAQADTVSDEASFVAKINDLRVSEGLPALTVNDNLVAKARAWAAGMAAAGRIWHSTLSDGITADWKKLGENVGMGGSVDGLHAAFVASPHHYENLVDPDFGSIGIGIVMNGGTIYVSEMFMELMPPKAPTITPPTTVVPAPPVTTPTAPRPAAPRPVTPKPAAPKPVTPKPAAAVLQTPVVPVAPVTPAAPPVTATPDPTPASSAVTPAAPADPPRAPSALLVSVLERLRTFDR